VLIRMLTKQEYSYYTIANSMLGLLSTLSDIGIGVALLAIGGRVWRSRNELGTLLRTGMSERLKIGLPVAAGVAIALTLLLIRAGSTFNYAGLLVLLVLFAFFFQYSISIMAVAFRLHSQANRMQMMDVMAGVIRLGLIGALIFLLPNAAAGIMVMVAVAGIQIFIYKRQINPIADLHQPPAPYLAREIRGIMLSLAPNALFQSIQSQIPIVLLTILGRASSVADFGALSRLAILFAVFSALNANLFHPAFARLQTKTKMIRGFWLIVFANCLVGLVSAALVLAFPAPFLWVLGSKYSHLQHELVLAVIGACLGLVNGSLFGVAAAKGWVQKAWLYIPATLISQIIGVVCFDLKTVTGALLLNIAAQIAAIMVFLFLVWSGFRKLQPDRPEGR
jgi:O-antigen/teichoic acid export membrane protein